MTELEKVAENLAHNQAMIIENNINDLISQGYDRSQIKIIYPPNKDNKLRIQIGIFQVLRDIEIETVFTINGLPIRTEKIGCMGDLC